MFLFLSFFNEIIVSTSCIFESKYLQFKQEQISFEHEAKNNFKHLNATIQIDIKKLFGMSVRAGEENS